MNRYRLIYTLLLTALMASTNASAGVTIGGNVYGGGNLADVKTNTTVNMGGGTVAGNVYGGGNLGSVGTYDTSSDMKTFDFTANTGTCNVTISGGTIGTGVAMSADGTFANGNVYGAGKGEADTYWCEKAMAYKTNVIINAGTVNGTVYGGGQIGRVENDATVIIGVESPANNTVAPNIIGNVFGAGAGLKTHGYSALLRGDTKVTIQGNAHIGLNVYGGGEKASVGRFVIKGGLPSEPADDGSGDCIVNVRGTAIIGTNTDNNITDKGNVYGTCQGVTPPTSSEFTAYNTNYTSMQAVAQKAPEGTQGTAWAYVDGSDNKYYWVYYETLDAYKEFLNTLALASHPVVTIGGMLANETTGAVTPSGNPTVNGSVFGGGQRGITLGTVAVNIAGGTIYDDVYGGGALADTNKGNQTAEKYDEATVTEDVTIVTGMYTRSGDAEPYTYTEVTTANTLAASGTTYYTKAAQSSINTTTVNLTGGYIKGDAYGGGLGQTGNNPIEAKVWGDISVNLGSSSGSTATAFNITNYTGNYSNVIKSGRVFGCNNLNGSPQGNVTVTVWKTVAGNVTRTAADSNGKPRTDVTPTYELAEVYGGGNLANFTTTGKIASVIIETCDVSVQSVYGGGNAADVPETDVLVKGAYEIGEVFGGGNGEDSYTTDGGAHWTPNPGANVNGNATTLLKGGYIHEAYGGSNTKGTISGNVSINKSSGGVCNLQVDDLYGAGKNADIEGDLIVVLGCSETRTKNVYGCAKNANVKGNVELTITSGEYGKVFGGNNQSGSIFGHIIVNIEETGCSPIIIDELYGCGNDAAYSVYGYYHAKKYAKTESGEEKLFLDAGMTIPLYKDDSNNLYKDEDKTIPLYKDDNDYLYIDQDKTRRLYMPRTSANDQNTAVTFEGKPHTNPSYADPEVNIISCTRIGQVYGGGYGANATVYGNPKVNINMIKGAWAGNTYGSGSSAITPPDDLGKIGDGYSYFDETEDKTIQVEGGVFGGGNQAPVYGNTNVNIGTETDVYVVKTNITTGTTHVSGFYTRNDAGAYALISDNDATAAEGEYYYEKKTVLGANITSNVYGGGKLANVGKTHLAKDENNKDIDVIDIEGSTFVNIGAVKGDEILDAQNNGTGRYNYTSVSFTPADAPGIFIGGNVYGGGEGEAAEPEGTNALPGAFRCGKAMVTKNTNVAIGNGTIGDGNADHGHVYGGGEKGRVEENTSVTIGCENDENSKPVITGNVFGAGKGVNTHGYSALTRGNSYVTVQGEAKVKMSVYGGGEIASVGKYNINAQGLPESLANQNSGYCTVIVRDDAVIGPDAAMVMTATGYPDDKGHVFGAGKGVLPYEGYDDDDVAWRVTSGNAKQSYLSKNQAIAGTVESGYLPYVETLGLATQTYVTIEENAFVKGSVYGGSENGYVQHDTQVNIRGNCQIGNGYVQMNDDGIYLEKLEPSVTPMGVNRRYTAAEWAAGNLIPDPTNEPALYELVNGKYYTSNSLPECASWPYGQASEDDKYAPWDMYDGTENYDSKGGRTTADDGHTFYGNVFGGGSGVIPYRPGQWHPEAGSVGGNTVVNITGGHILTNIYGGNELTDVYGKCTVNFGGTATLGVPRTPKQIAAHPLTCYLFGAGKGDQRVLFNKKTNVDDVEVNITGGWIYGSVFGGGEDGHVHHNVTMTISEADYATDNTKTRTKIGTWGTTYVDGNVFGGGRGFGADAYTAGNVAGTVTMNILGGTMLGSIYGGGRLGSVGYGLFDEGADGYGEMCDDNTSEVSNPISADNFKRGYVYMTIGNNDGTGPIIGNTWEYKIPSASNGPMTTGEDPVPTLPSDIKTWTAANWTTWREYNHVPKTEFEYNESKGYYMLTHTKGGNVFAGGMGNFYKQDGSTYINGVDWWKLGNVKSTTLTIKGGTIKSNVYGGGELGQVVGSHTTKNSANQDINAGTEITIQGSSTTIGTEVDDGSTVQYTFGSVFGSGYGSLKDEIEVVRGTSTIKSNPKFIAGLVKEDTKIDMQNGKVKASIYGGGEMASVGEATTESTTSGQTTTATGSTYVSVSGGTIGIAPITVSGTTRYFGGAKMGNVYGGGSGHNNTVRSGRILKNTNVTISGSNTRIYHNVYGGGAYGTVGDFDYQTGSDTQGGPVKVQGINGLATTGTGVANVTIIGGTIGYDGNENGMVFGSSRGDINEPGKRDDHCAWVYDTNVIIGTEGSKTGPQIKGTVYGSGENGHTYNNTVVTVNSGTIGIAEGSPIGTYTEGGATYPYRGNVYGGGCGTDTYPVTVTEGEGQSAVTKTIQAFNPLAGIVYGTTRVDINGGTVVRNVYGAGAMGSVGKTTWTTTTTGEGEEATTTTTATTDGGSTTVNINGGIIGISGTVGDGNVFGAARGSKDVVQADRDDLSRVRETNVTVSAGEVRGNVYGGGELGDVGTIVKNTTSYNYTWVKEDNSGSNVAGNNVPSGSSHDTSKNTGICNVTITGGTIGSATAGTGNVFGGGKGDANTWWCEKATAFATNVSISEVGGATTVVHGSVYGGGEIGRVEDDTKVIIGTANGSDEPDIKGNVFGAGKGLATRGYSALVRGNSIVTVQGSAQVGGNVFGGGEEASLGRFNLVGGLPKTPQSGGSSIVTIQDNAKIGSSGTGNHVYGAGQGVTPNYVGDYKNFKSMQLEKNKPSGDKGDTWDYYVDDDGNKSSDFVWVYYKTKEEYLNFLKTLALVSHPTVNIAENATVFGDVYGGGQRGLTLGDVTVNITGGTVKQDVYGGGSLADTNKGNWDDDRYVVATVAAGASVEGLYTITGNDGKGNPIYTPTAENATSDGSTTYYRKGTWAADKYNTTTHVTTYKTNVNLTGGTIDGNAYGGGLGQLAKAAVAAQGTEGQEGYVPAQPAMDAVEAKVYGDVLVKLNETTESDNCVIGSLVNANDPVSRNGNIFGCNNLNGSPQAGVTVHIHKTAHNDNEGSVATNKPTKNSGNYELQAVYGGGNLAAYYPDDPTVRETAKANVIIEGCDRTSIATVYGGGNAASVPGTEVVVNGTYEIGRVFGGGNGADDYQIDGKWFDNPGANVGYMSYAYFVKEGDTGYSSTTHGSGTQADPYKVLEYTTTDGTDVDASTKESRIANYGYGPGKAHATINLGTVHEVYGGSNSRGNVRVEARTTLEDIDPDNSDCPFDVGDAYGGGRNAPMDGDAVLEIGCINGLGKAYGGASNADVNGNVVLNITNGTYGRVFGGNDLGGNITGSITVNIEETGCRPIIIGELYGGGNEAGYSIYGYKKVTETDESTGETVQVWRPRESSTDSPDGAELSIPDPLPKSPQVNVKSFTSIGTVYGGGYGGPATMVGSPEVNINVFEGEFAETYNGDDNVIEDNARIVGSTVTSVASYPGYGSGYPIPSHAKGAIGAINNVFGGGNAAAVIGTPHVNIGTLTGEVITLASKKIEDSEGKAPTDEGWIPSYQLATVKGVDIRGNVYGAGNNAPVTGNTEVVIGKNNDVKTYSFTSYNAASDGTAWSSGLAQTTGATETISDKEYAEVVILTNGKYGEYIGKKFYVDPEGPGRLQLFDEDKHATSLWVDIEPFELKTYNFKSWSASSGGTQYSTGTAAPTGNFKTLNSTECMQIVVLTNPGETSWVGKTFYVPVSAKTDGTDRTQLLKADGNKESVWVEITE